MMILEKENNCLGLGNGHDTAESNSARRYALQCASHRGVRIENFAGLWYF